MPTDAPQLTSIRSVRPAMTARIMAETGLDEDRLTTLVHRFYDKVRNDAVLGPIFAERIANWGPHLSKMVDFWSSVALMTGRYHGAPVPKHVGLPVEWAHFERWLALFRETAQEVCTPAGAAHVTLRAERIARSLSFAIKDASCNRVGASKEQIMEAIWVAAETRADAAFAHSVKTLDLLDDTTPGDDA